MLKAYLDLMSQPSRVLYMYLKLSKIPHTICPVALRKGEHFTDEFKKINPFKVVPVIDDNGFLLAESVAILQYLSNKHPSLTEKLYPSDLQKRAKIDAFNNWQHLNLRIGGAGAFQALVIQPLSTGKPVNELRLQESLRMLKQSLNKMENVFLQETPFIYSDHLTIADLFGICELMQPKMGLQFDCTRDYPKIQAWSERVINDIGKDLFEEAHKFITQAGNRFVQMSDIRPKL